MPMRNVPSKACLLVLLVLAFGGIAAALFFALPLEVVTTIPIIVASIFVVRRLVAGDEFYQGSQLSRLRIFSSPLKPGSIARGLVVACFFGLG